MQELKAEHFREFHDKELLYNNKAIKAVIDQTINVYDYVAIYYQCFVTNTNTKFFERFTVQDKEALEKIVKTLELEYQNDYEDFNSMFNKCYKHGIVDTIKALINPDLIVENEATGFESMEFLKNYDKDARSFIAQIYTDTANKNIDLVINSINGYFKEINLVPENGVFNTDINLHLSNVSLIMKKYFDGFLTDSHNSYIDYSNRVAQKHSDELEEYIRELKKFKQKYLKPDMTPEELTNMITGFIREYFESDEKKRPLYNKYPTIIMLLGPRDNFNPKKFKKAIFNRYKTLGASDFEVEKKYLVSLIPKDSKYSERRKEIISIVNGVEKQLKEQEKSFKKEEKKVSSTYERHGLKEEELLEQDLSSLAIE